MTKRKTPRRYHVEVKHANLTQVQSEYAREFMSRKLLARDPADYFIHESENKEQSIHYVFRSEKLGTEIQQEIDHELVMHTDAGQVWAYRHWVEAPDRRMTGLFTETGIVAAIRPGDDFIGTMFKSVYGKVVNGYFNSRIYATIPEFGEITRLWFQGRSTEVWNARRRFRFELGNVGQEGYYNLAYALEKASEQLGQHASIGIVTATGDHYVITNRGVSASPYMSNFDWGEAWIFEYKLVELGVSDQEARANPDPDSEFMRSLKNASAKQAIKRRNTRP